LTIHPNAKTGAHHHGPLESVIYVVRGKARMRGASGSSSSGSGRRRLHLRAAVVPHQEINASTSEPSSACSCARNEAVVVNLDIAAVEQRSRVLGGSYPQAPARLTGGGSRAGFVIEKC